MAGYSRKLGSLEIALKEIIKDLTKSKCVFFEKGKKDTRLKHIYLTDEGKKLFDEIFSNQKKRIHKALLGSSPKEVLHFNKVIKRIINEKI